MSAQDSYRVQRLKRGGQFSLWKSQAEAVLIDLGLDEYLTMAASVAADAQHVAKDRRAKARIQLLVDGVELSRIVSKAPTAKKAWEGLENEFKGQLKMRRPALMFESQNLRQTQQETAEEYCDRAVELRDKMVDADMKGADEIMTQSFIMGIHESVRSSCLVTLTEMSDKGLDAITSKFKEVTRLAGGKPSDAQDNQARAFMGHGKGPRCYNCQEYGHKAYQCKLPDRRLGGDQDNGNGRKKKDKDGQAMILRAHVM